MFEKILIANRGEIACRVIRTAQHMGIKTVAIYSEVDSHAQHVKLADEAYLVGPAPAQQSYLNIQAIIEIAVKSNAQAIHPGYGFLSENVNFAKACEAAGIIFIGPPVEAIAAMGSKSAAKHIMQDAEVPVIPGYHGDDQTAETLLAQARDIGFPVLIKAVAGGGGKGMRSVEQENQFVESLHGAKREAKASFDDDRVLIEKLLVKPRHVEIQVFADNHGNAVYLFERDCSIQRRHQKVIEEAPAFNLSEKTRKHMGETAVTAAKAINYRGAGTIEFLVDEQQNFYFMEMNTRLQVEHPVTEMITGLDLVEWQLRVAANESLPLQQSEIKKQGHALEARIYAEDPDNNFMPAIGTITHLHLPTTFKNIRIDSSIVAGDAVSIYYDPMIAKLIAWGDNRTEAAQLLQNALNQYLVLGIKTNIHYLQKIISHPDFINEQISTHFINDHQTELQELNHKPSPIPILLASVFCLKHKKSSNNPWENYNAWQMNLPAQQVLEFVCDNMRATARVNIFDDHYDITIDDIRYYTTGTLQGNQLTIHANDQRLTASVEEFKDYLILMTPNFTSAVKIFDPLSQYSHEEHHQGQLTAPMPGTVVAVNVASGQNVKMGDSLMVIEAMKMEHTIHAPQDGVIKEVHYQVGEQVNEGDELLALEQ